MKKKIFLLGLIFLASSCLPFENENVAKKEKVTPSATVTKKVDNPENDNPSVQVGIIEGSLGFPSEGIPDDIRVCAENLDSGEEFCTEDIINSDQYTYGKGYQLKIPVGTYYVYAISPGYDSDYQAYYSEYVTCGMLAECESHEPISVELEPGEKISRVDPQDWYLQEGE